MQCYTDEDMVGRMKKLYNACHARTAPMRAMQRYSMLQALRWVEAMRKTHPQLRKRRAPA